MIGKIIKWIFFAALSVFTAIILLAAGIVIDEPCVSIQDPGDLSDAHAVVVDLSLEMIHEGTDPRVHHAEDSVSDPDVPHSFAPLFDHGLLLSGEEIDLNGLASEDLFSALCGFPLRLFALSPGLFDRFVMRFFLSLFGLCHLADHRVDLARFQLTMP